MEYKMKCPGCSKVISVHSARMGSHARCPECECEFIADEGKIISDKPKTPISKRLRDGAENIVKKIEKGAEAVGEKYAERRDAQERRLAEEREAGISVRDVYRIALFAAWMILGQIFAIMLLGGILLFVTSGLSGGAFWFPAAIVMVLIGSGGVIVGAIMGSLYKPKFK